MRIGIISVYVHRGRTGKRAGGVVQSGIGPLIAAFLPKEHEIDIIDETCNSIDWSVAYDLLFLTSFHSDFDRARQIAHYWRRRGAKTVYGGRLASTYPDLCQPYFDAIVVGDAEGIMPTIWRDFQQGELAPRYVAPYYDPDHTPVARYDLVARKRPLPLELEITRGCPFSCEFCILTAVGTRFQMRPTEHVVREIRTAWSQLAGEPFWKRRVVGFYDNNIGGNPAYLRKLCKALAPLHIRWSSSLTFNVLELDGMLDALAEAGCASIFVGLESFNPATLSDMRKFQNRIERIGAVIQACLKHGIVLSSGMVICSDVDTLDYIRRLPRYLSESGLYMPHFISFEAPFPGTPKFIRLASSTESDFLPGALLRDFDGYTLVVRPREGTPEEYAQAYQVVKKELAGWSNRRRKLLHDIPLLLAAGAWSALGADLFTVFTANWHDHPDRTFIAGTDLEPPEMRSVPFTEEDFQTERERDAILKPWSVTDEQGMVLPMWRQHQPVFVRTPRRQSL